MDGIRVRYGCGTGDVRECLCSPGTEAESLFGELGIDRAETVALRINNAVMPVRARLEVNADVETVTQASVDGRMIYRRSLAFLLALAARRLFPDRVLQVGHSLGYSYFYNFTAGSRVEPEEIAALDREMRRLVGENLEITFKYLSYADALRCFTEEGREDMALLLEQRSSSPVKVNECGGFLDLYVEPLVPNTGFLSVFALLPYEEGFLLRFPGGKTNELGEFADEPKVFEVYREYKKWGRIIGVRVVGELNALIGSGRAGDFIRMAEAHQARKIAEIAERIYARRDAVKAVLLAGPSSSGKTTTAKRLSIELMVMGLKPIAISLDSYYVGRDKTPLDEEGEPDYESLYALNIEHLNLQLKELCSGGEIRLPLYDFKTGVSAKDAGAGIAMDRRTVLIIEGIHALNDELTPAIPREAKFKLYVSALTQLILDNHNRIPTSDNRLLRRIVRDARFRANDAGRTISMWPKVTAAERRHIFPFQNTADVAFNSALDYELPVLKQFAEPLLRAVKPDRREYAEASRLLSFLENFAPIGPERIPGISLLREFIGDSEFKY